MPTVVSYPRAVTYVCVRDANVHRKVDLDLDPSDGLCEWVANNASER